MSGDSVWTSTPAGMSGACESKIADRLPVLDEVRAAARLRHPQQLGRGSERLHGREVVDARRADRSARPTAAARRAPACAPCSSAAARVRCPWRRRDPRTAGGRSARGRSSTSRPPARRAPDAVHERPPACASPRLWPSSCASTGTLNAPLIQTCDPPTSASPDQPQQARQLREGVHDVLVLRRVERREAVHRKLGPREDAGDAVAARRRRDGDLHRPVDVGLERDLAVRLLLVVQPARDVDPESIVASAALAPRAASATSRPSAPGSRRARPPWSRSRARRCTSRAAFGEGASRRTAVRLSETTSVPCSQRALEPHPRARLDPDAAGRAHGRVAAGRRRASAAARTIRHARRRARPRTPAALHERRARAGARARRRAAAPAARAMLPPRRARIASSRSASSPTISAAETCARIPNGGLASPERAAGAQQRRAASPLDAAERGRAARGVAGSEPFAAGRLTSKAPLALARQACQAPRPMRRRDSSRSRPRRCP